MERALGAAYVALDELMRLSDVVIPQLPAGPTTLNLIDRGLLRAMRPGALIVNVSRPDVIERAALIEAVAAGHLGGVALDPPYDTPTRDDDPLLSFPNVILSPQLAGSPRVNALDDFEEMLLGIARGLEP